MKNTNSEFIDRIILALASSGVSIVENQIGALLRHESLIREWSAKFGLVSASDLDRLWENHIADSLSLAPIILNLGLQRARHLDLGSGAGFPAIPLKVVLPALELTLLERSEKKIAFLRKVVAALKLGEVSFIFGEFPGAALGKSPELITARAVEQPKKFVRAVLEHMPVGCVYLCQSGEPRELAPLMFHVERKAQRFHVEQIADSGPMQEFRRGDLWLVKRTE